MSTFDPTDPQYRVSNDFEPDKESTWPFPPERDGWVLAHNALRGEMKIFREAFEAMKERDEPLKEWEIKAIKTSAGGHLEHINAHHSNEDDLFVPELTKRFHYPKKLVTDHADLIQKLEAIGKIIQELKPGDKIDPLLTEWTEYEVMMKPHLQEEEDIGLPLFRAYFTQKDSAPLIRKLLDHSPKQELGSIIYFEGVDGFRKNFMKQEGIPGFVWFIDFKPKYTYFVNVFITNVDALKKGKEPKAEPGCTVL